MNPVIVQSGRRIAATLAAALLCVLALSGVARAASFTVTTTADQKDGACIATLCSLRDAVMAADNAGGSSTITVPAGTYTLSIPSTGANDPATGDLDIVDPTVGAPTSVIITGAGAGSTTIAVAGVSAGAGVPATPIDRAFSVDSADASLALDGVTVTGGQPSAVSTGAPNGGAVYSNGSFTANGDAFTGNATGALGSGGAIDQAGSGALSVTGTSLSNNSATANGGAIADQSSANASITDSTLDSNQAPSGRGGALSLAGSSYALDEDEFKNNSAGSGGAVAWDHGTLTGRADAFVANTATTDGGALRAAAVQPLSLTDVTFAQNTAATGGALAFSAASPIELVNDTLWDNASNGLAGHGNAISGAAGLVGWRDGVQNTVLGNGSGSASGVTGQTCDAPLPGGVDQGYNLETDSSCLTMQPHDVTDPTLALGPPANNGGPVDTDAEPAGAPTIDAGTNTVCPPQDARGVSRPQGIACDIGAYEYPAPAPVSTSTTTITTTSQATQTSTVTATSTTTIDNPVTSTVTTPGPTMTAPAPTAPAGPPPAVTTQGVMAVTPTGAFLGGTVDPHGEPTTYSFQIGATPAYGAESVGAKTDTGPLSVETRVAGLTPNTLYHYRMVATSPGGSSAGADRTFRTLPSYNGSLVLRSSVLTVHAGAVAVRLACLSAKPCLLRFSITTPVRVARTHRLGTVPFTRPNIPLVRIAAHRTVTVQAAVTAAGQALLSRAAGHKLPGTLSTRPRSDQRGIVAPVALLLR